MSCKKWLGVSRADACEMGYYCSRTSMVPSARGAFQAVRDMNGGVKVLFRFA